MPERWRSELSKLSRAPRPPEAIPERSVREVSPSGPSPRARGVAIVVAAGVVAAAGFLVIQAFGGDPTDVRGVRRPGDAPAAPDVIEIRCSPEGSTASADVVRARPNGVHVRVEGVPGRTLFRVVGAGTTTAVKTDRSERRRFAFALAPGVYSAGCSRGAAQELAPDSSARFRVADPDRLWLASEPECSSPLERRIDIGEPRGFDDLDGVVRNGLPGLLATDVVRVPGYPRASPFSFRVPVVGVQREGRTVATVTSFSFREVIRVCPGTGIAEPERP